MADQSYPTDGIGNQVRKGDLVRVTLAEAGLVFRVMEVRPASILHGPDDAAIPTTGMVVLQAVLPMQYAVGQALTSLLVLKTPEDLIEEPSTRGVVARMPS